MDFPGLRSSLHTVEDRIRHHQSIGGWTHPVRIVAVTKTHGSEAVRAAFAAGLLDIGENRVQEALAKQDQLTDLPVRWHLIGTLQRNKARHAVGRFALIHSVDRAELAEELARRVAPGGRQAVLVEVNCSGESQKGGVEPAGLPALLDRISGLPSLELRGLMTMAALTADVAAQRTAFGRLRAERDRMTAAGYPLAELSMGMSGDYPIAVEEGATMVRLGTLLFGERTP
ncbi:MAG TPA: YggS family pyridoxal phosphate-dependent enzyme [Gemmatimonadales bacterium]|nr:YggS family pyridoxal phosphate-dependent enzyme [Gemmatimonadales bacterium]